jgi:hypothetical protein
MPRLPADPFAATDRLLVDGSNLLHALNRGKEPAPAAALIGRLRAAVPASIGIELVLDGPPEQGMHNTRVAAGLIVRYGARRSADHVLLSLVEEVERTRAPGGDRQAALDNILVVTDDLDLRNALRARGVRTAGTTWLIGRIERRRLESPSTGNARAPRPGTGIGTSSSRRADGPGSASDGEDTEPPRWSPGRGATTKRGNPKRGRPPAP